MGTLVILEGIAKAESVRELEDFLQRVFPDTRNYDGCQDITAYLNEDGKTIVMVEHWNSKEHYQKYLAWRKQTGVFANLSAMLHHEPTIRFFDAIDA
ncbi:MAG: antibiotic biosynthesis monooxygenase [Gammaproteobacteria bacterium]|nr:antibiotic biosynthesis monooxygenase [Gammaproteobacteria bacterium]MDH3411752.1 antibiotic biosynthesis monooxygenase [Gammaproteobacteria bacterium]